MKVLIIGHGRCGSSSLQAGLAKVLNLEPIIEPFNKQLWLGWRKQPPFKDGDKVIDNTVFKMLFNGRVDWVDENAHEFDHILVLMRDNFRDACISSANGPVHGYTSLYQPTERVSKHTVIHMANSYAWCSNVAIHHPKAHLVWYEDLYTYLEKSIETMTSWGFLNDVQMHQLYVEYLDPRYRLRDGTTLNPAFQPN